jgi:hypothetical protein
VIEALDRNTHRVEEDVLRVTLEVQALELGFESSQAEKNAPCLKC